VNSVSRRSFVGGAIVTGALPAFFPPAASGGDSQTASSTNHLDEEIRKEKIRRAMLSGPAAITKDATVADMDR